MKWAVLCLAMLMVAGGGWLAWSNRPSTKGPPDIDDSTGRWPADSGEKGRGPRKLGTFSELDSSRTTLKVPTGIDITLGPVAATPRIKPIGHVEQVLAAAFSPRGGPVFASTPDGRLLVLDGKTFSPIREYALPGAALHLAIDSARGRLVAAVSRLKSITLGRLDERDPTPVDLMAFDTAPLLAGKTVPGGGLPGPVLEHSLDANIHAMALGEGGNLYFIADSTAGLSLTIFDLITWRPAVSRPLPAGAAVGLSLAPENDRVYALAGGQLHAFGPKLGTPLAVATVGGTVSCPVGLRGGIVLVIERRVNATVLAVNLTNSRIVARWPVQMEGRIGLHGAGGVPRVVLSSTAVLHGQMWAIDCSGGPKAPTLSGEARSSPTGLLRGSAHVSPDGTAVILGNGTIFRIGP